jgi:hypothetical protein
LFPELLTQSRQAFAAEVATIFQAPHHGHHVHILQLALSAPGIAPKTSESGAAKIGPSANTAPNFRMLSELSQ